MKFNKILRAVLCTALAAAMSFSLISCGKSPEAGGNAADIHGAEAGEKRESTVSEAVTIGEPVISAETRPGYKSEAVENPPWIGLDRNGFPGRWNSRCFDTEGDSVYLGCEDGGGGYIGAEYDSISESWTEYQVPAGDAEDSMLDVLSVQDGSLWMCCLSGERGYYLVYTELSAMESQSSHMDFWDRSRCSYISDIKALDSERALVFSDEKIWLIDKNGQLLDTIVPDSLYPSATRIGDSLYIRTDTGIFPFDEDSMSLGESIYSPENSEDGWLINSTDGNFYMYSVESRTGDRYLEQLNTESGEKSPVLSCNDTALSYWDSIWGSCLRNSQGEFIRQGLIKTYSAEVPVKKPLKLLVMGQAGEKYYFTDELRISRELRDVIIRFNNSDPEFYIELVPFQFENELDFQVRLTDILGSGDIDLIDTSLLPEGALDSSLLTDILPYIDADSGISREDFIPGLLSSMVQSGGIYEYSDGYVLLTMYMPEAFYPGRENWNVSAVRKLISEHPDYRPDFGSDNIPLFALASTGEFIDMSTMTCSFDSPLFKDWLGLIMSLNHEADQNGQKPFLFRTCDSFSHGGPDIKDSVGGDYVLAGFPGAEGTGSYFMKPNQKLMRRLYGENRNHYILESGTRLGIPASGRNRDGSWRFMKCFIENSGASDCIKPLKSRFEADVEALLNKSYPEDYAFTKVQQSDGDKTREIVYNTEKQVCADEKVLDIIISAVNGYLGGKYTAEECAAQVQSRVSIYLAELS